jgi:hypothetical protein
LSPARIFYYQSKSIKSRKHTHIHTGETWRDILIKGIIIRGPSKCQPCNGLSAPALIGRFMTWRRLRFTRDNQHHHQPPMWHSKAFLQVVYKFGVGCWLLAGKQPSVCHSLGILPTFSLPFCFPLPSFITSPHITSLSSSCISFLHSCINLFSTSLLLSHSTAGCCKRRHYNLRLTYTPSPTAIINHALLQPRPGPYRSPARLRGRCPRRSRQPEWRSVHRPAARQD